MYYNRDRHVEIIVIAICNSDVPNMINLFIIIILIKYIIFCYTKSIQLCISFTSNGVLTDSVTGGDGDPLGPVVNPKGGGSLS